MAGTQADQGAAGPRYAHLDGALVAEADAALSPFDRGFIYGDAIYEVIPAFAGAPLGRDGHLHRLRRSAAAAYLDLDVEAVAAALDAVVEANAPWLAATPVARLGIWVSRGVQSLAWSPATAQGPTVLVFAWPVDDARIRRAYREGLRAAVAPRPRVPAQALDPRLKMTSRLPMVLAEIEVSGHADVPLLCDAEGHVTETSSANVFLVADGAVATPPATDALEGVTRGTVLAHAAELGVVVEERRLGAHDCALAEEAFLASSTSGILPLRGLAPYRDGLPTPGPVTRRLAERFAELTGFRPWE